MRSKRQSGDWRSQGFASREIGVPRRKALRAAGASRTYRRAFPAATGLSGASWALESLGGNPYPPIRAWADERTRRAYRTTMLFDTRLSRP